MPAARAKDSSKAAPDKFNSVRDKGRPFRTSQARWRNPDRVRYPDARQLAALAELVDGGRADTEPGRYLPDTEQVVRASRDAAQSRGRGGDKLLVNLSIPVAKGWTGQGSQFRGKTKD